MALIKVLSRFLLALLFFSVACSNVLDGMSDKTTDEALLEDARKAMNSQDWDLAIEKFDELSDAKKAEHATIEKWATAYAGKCGLNFVGYFEDLADAALSGTTFFKFLMNAWTGSTIYPTYCTLAQLKMEEISDSPLRRTSEQNLFMAVLGMVKVGVFLRTNLDRNGTDNLGDGTAELDSCVNDAANLSNEQLDQVITGYGLIQANLTYLTAVMTNTDITGAIDDVDAECNTAPGACGLTDPADITDGDRSTFRDLLDTGSGNPTAPVGVGSCNNVDVTLCC